MCTDTMLRTDESPLAAINIEAVQASLLLEVLRLRTLQG